MRKLLNKEFFLSALSAGLLIFAFPKVEWSFCVWFALVPLMWVLDGKGLKDSFRLGYVCGLIFFIGTLYWLVYVTVLGAAAVILYLSVYFGVFGWAYGYCSRLKPIVKMFFLPAVWVVLEFLRAHVFSGFDWVSLGHSQYKNLAFIQIADMTGVFGVSFLIVMVNVAVKECLVFLSRRVRNIEQEVLDATRWGMIAIALVLCGATLWYGQWRLTSKMGTSSMSVAVVQGNIDQSMKWQRSAWVTIMDRYRQLTSQAAEQRPDLILWPETSFSGFVGEHDDLFEDLKGFVKEVGIPLLFGSVSIRDGRYFNSAILLSGEGELLQSYDKVHLVPFGEFVPFRSVFPFLSKIVPIDDFSGGDDFKVFFGLGHPFSVLICFEDTVSRLSRVFVRNGSKVFVNMTNDAWFRDTKAPFLHLQSSVFRTVEYRRSLVRATNTGVSCFINLYGEITDCVENKHQKRTYVAGYLTKNVVLSDVNTVYAKYGEVFAYFCFVCILLLCSINYYGVKLS